MQSYITLTPPSGAGFTMDSVHSSSSQEAGPEGTPDGSVSTVIGTPMIVDLQSNQTAAVDTGTPVSSALQNPQPTAGTTGNPVSPYMQQFDTAPSHLAHPVNRSHLSQDDGILYCDFKVVRRKQKSKRKSSKISVTDSISGVVSKKSQTPTKPLLKSDIPKSGKIFLWNS